MIWSSLCRDAELESLVESLGRVVHPHEGEHEAENNDENVEAHDFPGHHLPPKILRCIQLLNMYVKSKIYHTVDIFVDIYISTWTISIHKHLNILFIYIPIYIFT